FRLLHDRSHRDGGGDGQRVFRHGQLLHQGQVPMSYTLLRLGEPRLKGKPKGSPWTPPAPGPIAENLCRDPSVEASTDLSELSDPDTWYVHSWAVDTKGIVPGYR